MSILTETLRTSRWLVLTLILLAGILLLFVLMTRVTGGGRKKRQISRMSIKEAMDTLPDAAVFFLESGTVKLCNRQMYRLFRMMTGKDLQSFGELQKALEDCGVNSPVRRDDNEKNVLLLPDGSAWKYSEHQIRSESGVYTEVIFSDVTALYERKRELERQSEELHELASKLQTLSQNTLALAREREILSAKTKWHDYLGIGLTGVRHLLLTDTGESDPQDALRMIKKAVEMLESKTFASEEQEDFDEFLMNAKTVGVDVEIKGKIPAHPKAAEIFMLAARECLTNIVRHSDASKLFIEVNPEGCADVITFSSEATSADFPIHPQGGLANLKQKAKAYGWVMEISPSPQCLLTITIPDEKED